MLVFWDEAPVHAHRYKPSPPPLTTLLPPLNPATINDPDRELPTAVDKIF